MLWQSVKVAVELLGLNPKPEEFKTVFENVH